MRFQASNEASFNELSLTARIRILVYDTVHILQSLQPGKITPEVFQCPDGHFWCVIWGIGPYIADYPEQVLLACIVKNWCAQ